MRTHEIRIQANVSDESEGNVYVMAFLSNVGEGNIQTAIVNASWDYTNLAVQLQQIQPDNVYTEISGNITKAYANLDDNNGENIEEATNYYLYMYAVDTYNNRVVQAYANNPLRVSIETTVVFTLDDFLIDSTNTFTEVRNAPLSPTTIINKNSDDYYFGFHDNKHEWNNRLFANVEIIPYESVVGNVYTIATETNYGTTSITDTNALRISDFARNHYDDTLVRRTDGMFVFGANSDAVLHEITTFYANVDQHTINSSMTFGNEYHIYSIVHDKGFDKHIVHYKDTVITGTSPVLTNLSATVYQP